MIIDQEKQTQTNLHLESHNYQITFVTIDVVSMEFWGLISIIYISPMKHPLRQRIVERWLSLRAMHMHRPIWHPQGKGKFFLRLDLPVLLGVYPTYMNWRSESATAQGFVLFCVSFLFFSWTISVSLFRSSKIKVFKLCEKVSVKTVI